MVIYKNREYGVKLALRIFRIRRLINDESKAVRKVMIELAGEIGSEEDISWLVEHNEYENGEGKMLRDGILKILQRQDADVVVKWGKKLDRDGNRDEDVKKVLEVAEGKAESQINDENADILGEVWYMMVDCCWRMGEYDNVIVYCKKLLEMVKNERVGGRVKIVIVAMKVPIMSRGLIWC